MGNATSMEADSRAFYRKLRGNKFPFFLSRIQIVEELLLEDHGALIML